MNTNKTRRRQKDRLRTLKYEKIVRTSSSKPMSIMRSASSRQRYRQTSRFNIFLSSMSIRRPGVAVITCTPLQTPHHSNTVTYQTDQTAFTNSKLYFRFLILIAFLSQFFFCYHYFLQCCDTVGQTWAAGTMSVKQKMTKPLGGASTLQVEWQEGHPAHKNPVVVPVSLSFVTAPAHPGYPGSKGCKTVVRQFSVIILIFKNLLWQTMLASGYPSVSVCTLSIFMTDFNKTPLPLHSLSAQLFVCTHL